MPNVSFLLIKLRMIPYLTGCLGLIPTVSRRMTTTALLPILDPSSMLYPTSLGLHVKITKVWIFYDFKSLILYLFEGVHSNVFELENWHVDAWNADLKVRYYWTDPDHWTGTSGTGVSIPVAVMFAGTAQTKENTTVPIDEIIEFQSFFEVDILFLT